MALNVMQLIASLDRGGAERVVVDLASGLDREKYNTTVAYLQGRGELAGELRDCGVNVFRLPDGAKTDPRVIGAVRRLFEEEQVDILHTHIARPAFWGLIAGRLASIPVRVYTEHNIQRYEAPIKYLYPTIIRLATDIVCVSDGARDSLARRYPKSDGKLITVRNGLRCERINPTKDRGTTRRDLMVDDDEILICNVANLRKAKAQHYLIRAFARVRSSIPDSKLIIVGTGDLLHELEISAENLGQREHVSFLGERSDVADLLAASDLFVLSSINEGLPITILEAMAAGLPVVTTDVGGCAEAVQDGVTGLVVPPESPERLAEAMIRLLSGRREAASMGAAGRARVAKEFSLQHFVEQHEQLYETAWARRKGQQ